MITQQSQPTKEKAPFVLNKTKVNELGLNLSSEDKLYEQLACPFEEDGNSAHPLNAKYPEGFQGFDFYFDKVACKLNEEAMIYIFYNVMDERLQMHAARTLMANRFRYNKVEKIWIRKFEGKFEYFNIVEWKYMEYTGNTSSESYCTQADFSEK